MVIDFQVNRIHRHKVKIKPVVEHANQIFSKSRVQIGSPPVFVKQVFNVTDIIHQDIPFLGTRDMPAIGADSLVLFANQTIFSDLRHILVIDLHSIRPGIEFFGIILEIFRHPFIRFPFVIKADRLVLTPITRVGHSSRFMFNRYLERIDMFFCRQVPIIPVAKEVARFNPFAVKHHGPIELSVFAPKVGCTEFQIHIIQED